MFASAPRMLAILWNASFLLVVPAALCFLVYYKQSRSRMALLIKNIPSPPTLPLFGVALDFLGTKKDVFSMVNNYIRTYGDVVGSWFGPQLCIVISRPEAIEDVLGSMKHIDKSVEYNFLHAWLGTGLLTSTGQKWRVHRKILTPSFHFKILEEFVDVFNKCSTVLVEKLKHVGSSEIDVFERIAPCTLDIILETAIGISLDIQNNHDCEYVKAVYRITEILHTRHFKLWLRPDVVFNWSRYKKEQAECLKVLHGLSRKVIADRKLEKRRLNEETGNKNTIENAFGEKRRLAFLDLLIEASENGKVLNDEEIREEVDTFMFEGHDTTATAISFALYLLGSHPDYQEKVVDELRSIFGDSDRAATMQDLNEMKYLGQCIKDALRLYPSVPIYARELKEDVRTGDFVLPAGATIIINSFMAHRNKDIFPNPEEFNPDNFLHEKIKGRHPYSYVPFSAGPRNCIGQKFAMLEEKAVISSILRRYKIESIGRPEDLHMEAQIILKAGNGLKIKVLPRN